MKIKELIEKLSEFDGEKYIILCAVGITPSMNKYYLLSGDLTEEKGLVTIDFIFEDKLNMY